MPTHFSIKAALWGFVIALLQHSSLASDPVDWAALTVPEDPPLQYTGDVRPSTLQLISPDTMKSDWLMDVMKTARSYHA